MPIFGNLSATCLQIVFFFFYKSQFFRSAGNVIVKRSSRILFIFLYLQFIDTLGSKYMLMVQDTILE